MTFLERTVIPVLFFVTIPTITICAVHLVVNYESDVSVLYKDPYSFTREAFYVAGFGDKESWIAVLGLAIWGAVSLTIFGGKIYHGPSTKNGFVPKYKMNAFPYFLITLTIAGLAFYLDLVPGYHWYMKLVPLSGALMTFFFVLSVILYVKGLVAPSPGEYGSSGNPIFDFYWGLELYPRFGKWFDVKLFSVSRFGIMAWLLLVLITWKAQVEIRGFNLAMAASSLLQIVYIGKFYYWEDGYISSIDIIVDRLGWYLCFGAGGFMPEFFILNNAYQVDNETNLNEIQFASVMIFGVSMTLLTYWIDYQRQLTRDTKGKCMLWGKPAKIIRAKYKDETGREKSNILLASGFWGWCRHPNYVAELLADLAMVLPVKTMSIIPYTYVIFLLVLVVHRSFRDEKKCREKYGKYWKEYCQISKYRLVPFIF